MISIAQYRAAIGHWNNVVSCKAASEYMHIFNHMHTMVHFQYLVKHCLGFIGIALSGVLCNMHLYSIIILLLFLSSDIHPNPGPDYDLQICHLNTRSLVAQEIAGTGIYYKLDEIEALLCNECKFDIICISETWLGPQIDDSEIHIDGYTSYRRDRNRQGGGVAIYITNLLVTNRRRDLESDTAEMIWVEFLHNSKKIIVGVCYRPPGQSADNVSDFLDDMQTSLDGILAQHFLTVRL
jgi:hypothetical protein